MASAFWYLEDGRGFARRWAGMAYMLELITDQLRELEGAREFWAYLEPFVCRDGEDGNGWGGFVRGNESIDFNFDLRSFAPQNRAYFWEAARRALAALRTLPAEPPPPGLPYLTILLDMHERIERGEDPMELNHLVSVTPPPDEREGPGW